MRREGVTEAAGKLQDTGLIHYQRGRITVLDRPGLEARSCEWRTEENGIGVVYDKEPRVDLWRRFKVDALSLLPIESQL